MVTKFKSNQVFERNITFTRIVAFLVVLGCLLPGWLAYYQSESFVFVNAWDEETYLSMQGALGASVLPGYYISYLNYILNVVGVSGAVQNLIFDTLLLPGAILFIALALKRFNVGRYKEFELAVVICLSSVLFNYANPLTGMVLGPYNGSALFMAGWEYYPSILRTPNPQFTFFLVALTVYVFSRCRKWWLLLLPLPLMYYYVAVPYLIFIGSCAFNFLFSRNNILTGSGRVFASLVVSYFFVCAALVVLFYVQGLYSPGNPIRYNSFIFYESRFPQVPLYLLVLVGLFGGALALKLIVINVRTVQILFFLAGSALATVNVHVVSGFMLSQKNYYDYGVSLILGVFLTFLISQVRFRKFREFLLVVILVAVGIPSFFVQMRDFKASIYIGNKIDKIIDEVKKDPLHSLILDRDVSSKIAYSQANLISPPFSYLYNFPFVSRQCEFYEDLLGRAVLFTKNFPNVDASELDVTVLDIKRGLYESRASVARNYHYCTEALYTNGEFKLMMIK
ncbi:MAG: hypothetical protein EWV78_10060 [Microcystis aeruginosa Ma_MB_F_20061100_S20D]|uniref:Glycosyltransferase RgtA/B/C/D-like domain-containing protein n=1 Tax=Microcystis aeruginosa Ma_MB_F_20061100_S20D TaxID=2486253 RepID=A0A552ENE4_MICAE|nr:MAG: hypothetical protein EWV78_10060 [Microcystis aeruginosa Ma_MB_F_20061100_S20D]